MFHPVKRVVGTFRGKLDATVASLASDKEWSVYFCHGVVPQLLFSSQFSRGSWWGVRPPAVMGECRVGINWSDTDAVSSFTSGSLFGDPL